MTDPERLVEAFARGLMSAIVGAPEAKPKRQRADAPGAGPIPPPAAQAVRGIVQAEIERLLSDTPQPPDPQQQLDLMWPTDPEDPRYQEMRRQQAGMRAVVNPDSDEAAGGWTSPLHDD